MIPAFAGGNSGDNRLPVAIVNQDQSGVLSSELLKLLDTSSVVRTVVVEEKDQAKVGEAVRDNKYTAALTLPTGYSEQLIADKPVKPLVIVDQSNQKGQSANNAIQGALSRLLSAVQIARQTTQTFEPVANATVRQSYFNEALLAATKAWSKPALSVKVEQTGEQASSSQQRAAAQVSPGMMVQFVILGLINSAMVLMLERKTHALTRMLTTPISRVEIIAGHVLAMLLLTLLQEIILVAFGQIFYNVNYLREPLATLLVMVALALWTSSLGLLIGVFAKVQDQVVAFSMIAMFVFAMLGGCWVPLDITGPVFSAVAHITPTAWAMDGFQNIIVRGQGLSAVLLPVAILLAYAVGCFALASWKFQARFNTSGS
jgi:ABC-2 type transport system permease protein